VDNLRLGLGAKAVNFPKGVDTFRWKIFSWAEVVHSTLLVPRLHKTCCSSTDQRQPFFLGPSPSPPCFEFMFADTTDLFYAHPRDRLTPTYAPSSGFGPHNAPAMDVESMNPLQYGFWASSMLLA
jgi:hypothetical protein